MTGDNVEITCLCGQIQDTVQLQSQVPLKVKLCHCNSCRCANGTLCSPSLPIAAIPSCVPSLQCYQLSANIRRYFCGSCGTNICCHFKDIDSWYLRSGVVERVAGNEQVFGKLEEIVEHQFVEDTLDGGLAPCLTEGQDTSVRYHLQGFEEHSADLRPDPSSIACKQSRLRAACHCGGVEFFVSRPNEASRACSSPWPDLIRPYHIHSSYNIEDQKWWIRTMDKFLAGTCACRSCRLAFASPITCWAFIPKANLLQSDGTAFTFDISSLASHESSKDTYRNFCKNCGAPIFWHNEERPELIDVSVGVLHAEEGARAGTWLEWWTERVSFIEDAVEHEFVAAFATGLHSIGKEH